MTTTHDANPPRFYHGTRADLQPGDLIAPGPAAAHVYLSPDMDAAIWEAEISVGEGRGRVYLVEPTGAVVDASALPGHPPARHPAMSWRSGQPLRVTGEVTEWTLYHGTRADLKPGDLIEPGRAPNFGRLDRLTTYVYLAATLDAAVWGAELALGDAPGRIYVVEPTGPMEDDPNLTDKKFRGNPTRSYRSRHPLRITGEVVDWRGHAPDVLRAMLESVERMRRLGVEPLDD
ncbi:MAG: NAD(+)--rifampin ADP-ribosyltransferase [Gemmatimonadota bacterium]|nr:NAD(+)--rifampin ADP-ribosyltransferase [Gemmatimonadota bacterium]